MTRQERRQAARQGITTEAPSPNLIMDRDVFKLTPPPAWFLRRLYDFDPDLVVIPSRQQPIFWLARRWRLLLSFTGKKMDGVGPSGDVQMFITHKLVDVCTLAKLTTDWTELNLGELLTWLKDRDTWAEEGAALDMAGIEKALSDGGSKVTKRVEYDEKIREQKKATAQRETIWHATGDAYRSLQARLGRRIMNPGLPKGIQQPSAGA